MFKSRRKKSEEEARQDANYRPTKELEAEEEKPQYDVPWTGVILIASLVAIIVVAVVIMFVFGGPR